MFRNICRTSLIIKTNSVSTQVKNLLIKRQKSEFIAKLKANGKSVATIDTNKVETTYSKIYRDASVVAYALQYGAQGEGLRSCKDSTIAAYFPSESNYVKTLTATWLLGKTFVPLCNSHTLKEIEYFVEDSNVKVIFCNSKDYEGNAILKSIRDSNINGGIAVINIESLLNETSLEEVLKKTASFPGESSDSEIIKETENALVLYTSGTTGKPKGVLHTHTGVTCMIKSLVESWEYSSNDRILHFLPLHHLHGVLNKLLCTLWAGGIVEFISSAAPQIVWNDLSQRTDENKPTMFMGVPTVYSKLLESAVTLDPTVKSRALNILSNMRFHVCGSAALPDVVMDSWKALTGHTLLERYGMSEIGMALSNPYRDASKRLKGSVGFRLPYIDARIVNESGDEIKDIDTPGELLIKGPTVFVKYLNKPEATAETFDKDGWFKTGDIAQIDKDGYYKLLGRNSTDIIKRAGYKLSALEIEREILSHPQVLEAAVLGCPDAMLGEQVICVIVLRKGDYAELSLNPDNSPIGNTDDCEVPNNEKSVKLLNEYLKDKLAYYKYPKKLYFVDAIPRNHMGKVNKKTLITDLSLEV